MASAPTPWAPLSSDSAPARHGLLRGAGDKALCHQPVLVMDTPPLQHATTRCDQRGNRRLRSRDVIQVNSHSAWWVDRRAACLGDQVSGGAESDLQLSLPSRWLMCTLVRGPCA
ncbi:hypothetical protein H1C71_041967 [Ictidomys tridecemlineatus]|nr:hypothetical protein H1C71_041967 [Ictidomys tridecemlineatus]